MNTFHLAFGVGFDTGPGVSAEGGMRRVTERERAELTRSLTDEEFNTMRELVVGFAARRFGLQMVSKHDPQKTALTLTSYPVTEGETIRWDRPLFDSEGFEHTLVSLGAREVVTKQSFTFSVWDRKTGSCHREGAEGMTIGNKPMSPQERSRRAAQAQATWEAFKRVDEARSHERARATVLLRLTTTLADRRGMTESSAAQVAAFAMGCPQDMQPEVYEVICGIAEEYESAVASGQDARNGFNAEHNVITSMMDAAPWMLDPDGGEIVPKDPESGPDMEVPR